MKLSKKTFFENFFKIYGINYISLFNYRRIIRFNVIIGIIKSIPKINSKKILDVGCGAGPYTIFLNKNNIKTTGIDLDDRLLKKAGRYLGNQYFIKASALKLPFNKNSFDVILMSEILEHLDDKKAISEARRLLRSDGYLIISVPTERYSTTIHNPEEHIREGYTIEGVNELLNLNGFGIIDFFYSGFFLESALKKIDFGLIGSYKRDTKQGTEKKNPQSKTFRIFSRGILFILYKYLIFPFIYILLSLDPISSRKEGLNLIVLARKK